MNIVLLKIKLLEKGTNIKKLSEVIGISVSAFYQKLNKDGDFRRNEIKAIRDYLNLTEQEVNSIFFSDMV